MTEHDLDGTTIDYTYDGGGSFRVRFYDGLVAYEFLGEQTGEISRSNENIPYVCRSLGYHRYHVAWHEKNIGDFVSLIIDEGSMDVFSAALLGYESPDAIIHFEHGTILTVDR